MKRRRPRRGSLQFWPRKRAKRIYPQLNSVGFAGWKAGMTHVSYADVNAKSPTHGKTLIMAATIIDSPPLLVCGLRFYKKKNHTLFTVGEKWIDNIPEGLKRKVGNQVGAMVDDYDEIRLIISTQPEKGGMAKKKPEVFEMQWSADAKQMLGKEIFAKDVFKVGEYVDVSGVTKGHGFTGPVKRFHIRIQRRKDQQHHRHAGSIGTTTPRKVDWRVPLPGQYGFFTRTELNKNIVMIGDDSKKITPDGGFLGYGPVKDFILIKGSIPGPRKRLMMLKKATRTKRFEPVDVKFISTESKQGK
ncbi:MAG: 50S ribosomal protein L3 [Candidatus Aenigmatarchaeota archaeon]